ncbi:MAG: M48 family metalloprotease [Thiolinea sp.]
MNRPQIKHLLLTGLLLLTVTTQAEQNTSFSDLKLQDFQPPAHFDFATGNIDESAIGRQLFRKIRQRRILVEDPELNAWLQSLVQRLTRNQPAISKTIKAVIVNNPEINAHALRGGIILVNSGLILSTETESELAAVLAHEIAHVSQKHINRLLANRKNSPWLTGLGILAGAAVASKNPQAGQAIITGASAISAHNQLVYTQGFESEADRVGLRTLHAAGFNPAAMPYFLEKLERSELNLYGSLSKYLHSHPLTIERLSDTRNRANRLGRTQVRESVDYLYAREKLRSLSHRNHTQSGQPLTGAVKRYQQAIQASQRGEHQRVLQLLSNTSGQLAASLLVAQSLNAMKRYAEAERLLHQLTGRFARHEALIMTLAQTLHGKGQSAQALQWIDRIRISDKISLEFIEAAQRIAQQSGKSQQAIFYNAQRKLLTADYQNAERILQQTLRAQNIDSALRARLQRTLSKVRQAKQEQHYLKQR